MGYMPIGNMDDAPSYIRLDGTRIKLLESRIESLEKAVRNRSSFLLGCLIGHIGHLLTSLL